VKGSYVTGATRVGYGGQTASIREDRTKTAEPPQTARLDVGTASRGKNHNNTRRRRKKKAQVIVNGSLRRKAALTRKLRESRGPEN